MEEIGLGILASFLGNEIRFSLEYKPDCYTVIAKYDKGVITFKTKFITKEHKNTIINFLKNKIK